MFGHRDHESYLAGLRDSETARSTAETAAELAANLFGRRTASTPVVTVYADELANVNASSRALFDENKNLRADSQALVTEYRAFRENDRVFRESVKILYALLESREKEIKDVTAAAQKASEISSHVNHAYSTWASELWVLVGRLCNSSKYPVGEEEALSKREELIQTFTRTSRMSLEEIRKKSYDDMEELFRD